MQQAEGARLASTVAKAPIAVFEALAVRGDHQRQPSIAGQRRERVGASVQGLRLGARGDGDAEHFVQQRGDEALRQGLGIARAGAGYAEVVPVRFGDAPVAPQFVAQIQALWNTVIRRGLARRLQGGHLGQPFRRQQAAFQANRVELQHGILAAAHATPPGNRT